MDYYRSFTFDFAGAIKYGMGTANSVGEEAKKLGARRVLIVTDKGIVKAGLVDKSKQFLKLSKIETLVFDEVEPNPRDKTMDKGSEVACKERVDLIVGIGGGSALDVAKAIALLATNGGSICDYCGEDEVRTPPLPLIVIPTTAGTGSEVSPWISLEDTSTLPPTKTAVYSRLVSPRLTLADPLMTKSLPPFMTASIGMDGLTSGIEAYTSLEASPLTDALSLYSVQLMANSLPRAFANGDDLEARAKMMLGSLMAGIAFINSSVGGVHSMALAIGGLYDTPHGLSCAVFLPYVMEYNLIANPKKYADIAQAMGENVTGLSIKEAALKSVEAVRNLMKDIGIPSPQEIGVQVADIPKLANIALASHCSLSNPRKPTEEDFVKVLKHAMDL
jgi:alcohol dehydrogenase